MTQMDRDKAVEEALGKAPFGYNRFVCPSCERVFYRPAGGPIHYPGKGGEPCRSE